MQPTPCIHTGGTSLCSACKESYDADPAAWEEYGDHPAGIERWRQERETMARFDRARFDSERLAEPDQDVPF